MAKTLRTGKTRKTPPPKPARQRGFYFDKSDGQRVVGVITRPNAWLFEQFRRELAQRSLRDLKRVSDADVIEVLVNVVMVGVGKTYADLEQRGVFPAGITFKK